MDVSPLALDLIAEFEGIRLNAYLDLADVPTIGYGTTRYPDGRSVRIGDALSEPEAMGYLQYEAGDIARNITGFLGDVALSQNQFDALVSFTYNNGLGAFHDSTMLKHLRKGSLDAAAAEFPRWNKATVNGVKQEIEGLTRRREKERALFEKVSRSRAVAARPLEVQELPEERVVAAVAFSDGGLTTVSLLDDTGAAVDVVTLVDTRPVTLAALIDRYPRLATFSLAGAGAEVPPGERRPFALVAHAIQPVATAPILDRGFLALGSADSDEFPGNDVRELQTRLAELGYHLGPITGVFDSATDSAARTFQAVYFGPDEVDGKVGPLTWAMLFPTAAPAAAPATGTTPGRHFLRLTNTSNVDGRGLNVLLLEYVKNGSPNATLEVCSGARGRQAFRTGANSESGSLEPLPEGLWRINDIEWVNGKDNYSSGVVFDNGIGPVRVRLDYKKPGTTRRSEILFHIDWNRNDHPGTAGCIGVANIDDLRTLVSWLRDTDPRDLFVDWGLGTCPTP